MVTNRLPSSHFGIARHPPWGSAPALLAETHTVLANFRV
jgi:hypothetical protein